MDWIKTRIMLPPFDKEVLVMDKNGYIYTAHLSATFNDMKWIAYVPKVTPEGPGSISRVELWDISWWQEFWGRPQGKQFHEIAQAIVDNLGKSADTEDDDPKED
jgi:hypothetical protein